MEEGGVGINDETDSEVLGFSALQILTMFRYGCTDFLKDGWRRSHLLTAFCLLDMEEIGFTQYLVVFFLFLLQIVLYP